MHHNYDAKHLSCCQALPFSIDVMFYDHFCFKDGEIDMDNDWKLLTLLIGGTTSVIGELCGLIQNFVHKSSKLAMNCVDHL